jgi:hypothetical protein
MKPLFINRCFIQMRILLLVALISYGPSILSAQYPGASSAGHLLEGAVDIHMHTAPDIFGRSVNDLEAAGMAEARGFRAIVLKNHISSTAGRAALANLKTQELMVFGGIALNRAVGGLNPEAVRNMALMEGRFGRFVWFPTFDAGHHQSNFGSKGTGLSILEEGTLKTDVLAILDLIKTYDLVLATGHLSGEEVVALVQAAHERGIWRIVITHAMGDSPGLTLEEMQMLSKYGVYFELTYLSYLTGPQSHLGFLQNGKHVSIAQMAEAVKAIGAERFIMSTDLGQSGNPVPSDGMLQFVTLMLNAGLSETEVITMIRKNPYRLLFGKQD